MSQDRKMSKRITAMALVVLMASSIIGCGSDKQPAEVQEPSTIEISESVSSKEAASEMEVPATEQIEVSSETEDSQSKSEESETIGTHESDEVSLEQSESVSDEKGEALQTISSETPLATEGYDEQDKYSETPDLTIFNDEIAEDEFVEEEQGLTDTQRNSVNMLNYMTLLTEQINENRGNQIFLDSAYLSLKNDIFPKVDTKTQGQITRLMDTIEEYRMILVKRERLNFIYEQNRAQALRKAIPNPVGLLSAVQSGSLLKAAASVLYMAVDAKASYDSATSAADLQFIKDGWELDSAESEQIHNSTTTALNYMFNMVRDFDLPGDYALSAEAVEDFVSWSSKPDSQLVNKIRWLESHEDTYKIYGPYWLERAKDYYN